VGLRRHGPVLLMLLRLLLACTSSPLSKRGTATLMTGAVASSSVCHVRLVRADGERIIDVQRGELLRTALLRKGATPHNAGARLINCRGLGSCGTCAVEIDGSVEPAEHTDVERLRLSFPPHSGARPGFRLACQCTVQGDIVVRKRDEFWGQGTELAPERADARVTWFGDLEFLLDNKSPAAAPCSSCGGTKTVECPLCEGGTLVRAYKSCSACHGSGQVVCRSCFDGNPWDLEAIRAQAARRPD